MAPEVTQRLVPVLRRIDAWIAEGAIEGAALAAAVGGEQMAEWYGGRARPDLAAGPEVLWPLASISKLYTAAAVMALVERGALTLGTPVSRFLPAFTGDGRETVTIGHLLTHTSGLIYESPRMAELLAQQTPLEAMVDEAYSHPLHHPPGARISYSDYGYALAGRIAALAAGMPFPQVVRSLVLEPGGLRATYMPPAPKDYRRVAHITGSAAYGTEGAMYNSPYALALAHPAFAAVASVNDLLRFGLLFAPGGKRRLLSEAAVRSMTTDQTGGALKMSIVGRETDEPRCWGMGFMVRGAADREGFFGDLFPAGSFGHPGASGCMLAVSAADGVAVAYVSNRHVNTGLEGFLHRNAVVLNGVIAALTRR